MKIREDFKIARLNETLMLTFLLRKEAFAVETIYVKEIVDYSKPTQVPGAPKYFKGLINLRGLIVPIIDLSEKFTLEGTPGEDVSIIILEFSGRQFGFLVDRVMQIIRPKEEEIELASLDVSEESAFFNIKGTINMPQQSYFILDVEDIYQEVFL